MAGRRCIGLTRNLGRCGRTGNWAMFCEEHRRQPLAWVIFLVFTVIAGTASIQSAWFRTGKSAVDSRQPDLLLHFSTRSAILEKSPILIRPGQTFSDSVNLVVRLDNVGDGMSEVARVALLFGPNVKVQRVLAGAWTDSSGSWLTHLSFVDKAIRLPPSRTEEIGIINVQVAHGDVRTLIGSFSLDGDGPARYGLLFYDWQAEHFQTDTAHIGDTKKLRTLQDTWNAETDKWRVAFPPPQSAGGWSWRPL